MRNLEKNIASSHNNKKIHLFVVITHPESITMNSPDIIHTKDDFKQVEQSIDDRC